MVDTTFLLQTTFCCIYHAYFKMHADAESNMNSAKRTLTENCPALGSGKYELPSWVTTDRLKPAVTLQFHAAASLPRCCLQETVLPPPTHVVNVLPAVSLTHSWHYQQEAQQKLYQPTSYSCSDNNYARKTVITLTPWDLTPSEQYIIIDYTNKVLNKNTWSNGKNCKKTFYQSVTAHRRYNRNADITITEMQQLR